MRLLFALPSATAECREQGETFMSTKKPPSDSPGRLTFGARMSIRRGAEFDAVYEAAVRRNAGPLLIYAMPNGLTHPRLGMSVSRRVGNAVTRNTIRRRIRESFRQSQRELPSGYDFVISVRPHDVLPTADYCKLLLDTARALDDRWIRKRQARQSPSPPESLSPS
jgi:ribonuclease P protein component